MLQKHKCQLTTQLTQLRRRGKETKREGEKRRKKDKRSEAQTKYKHCSFHWTKRRDKIRSAVFGNLAGHSYRMGREGREGKERKRHDKGEESTSNGRKEENEG